jgi:hypothetical protein
MASGVRRDRGQICGARNGGEETGITAMIPGRGYDGNHPGDDERCDGAQRHDRTAMW